MNSGFFGLGSIFEYHYAEPEKLRENIEGTKEYILLARDVGTSGIKVRPNRLVDGVPPERTLEQIGRAFGEVAAFGADHGIEVRMEVHGSQTCRLPNMRKILDHANHPNAKACWNCNQADLEDDGFDANLDLVSDCLTLVHLHDLYDDYPYQRLFKRLHGMSYDGFGLAEIPASSDPIRVMRYYRALFLALQPQE